MRTYFSIPLQLTAVFDASVNVKQLLVIIFKHDATIYFGKFTFVLSD